MPNFHEQRRSLNFTFGQRSSVTLSAQVLAQAEEQQKTEWCWAAVLRLVLLTQPTNRQFSQTEIVQAFYGTPTTPFDQLPNRPQVLGDLFLGFVIDQVTGPVLNSSPINQIGMPLLRGKFSTGFTVPAKLVWSNNQSAAHALALCGHATDGTDWLLVYNPSNDNNSNNNLEWCPLGVLLTAYAESHRPGKFGKLTQVYL